MTENRILARRDTVDALFERVTVPFEYSGDDGQKVSVDTLGFRCRTCGWKSLPGMSGLPFPHVCQAAPSVDLRY